MSFGKCLLKNVARKFPQIPLVCVGVHLQNLTLRPWIWLCCWLSGYIWTAEPFYILNANETAKKYQIFERCQDFENTRKWKEMFSRKSAFKHIFKKSGKIAHFAKAIKIIQKKWLLTHIKEMFNWRKWLKIHLIIKKWHHFEKWQKWPFSKVGRQIVKMTYLGDEFRWSRIIESDRKHTQEMFYGKNSLKSHLILKEWHDFEKWQNWPFCEGYSKPKWTITVSSEFQLLSAKSTQKYHDNNNIVILCKKRLKKHPILKKRDRFEKWKKWPFCKGCSNTTLSKMTYFGVEL